MRISRFTACLLAAGAFASPAFAQKDAAPPAKAATVNAMCPIGEERIDPEVKPLSYKGRSIGFCCGSCEAEFLAWDEKKRDEWVTLAVAHKEPGQPEAPAPAVKDEEPVLYTLGACPISGKALGSMGDPVVKVYEGREVRFCCDACLPRFERDLAASLAKLDEKLIKDQAPYYPTSQCVVSDEPADEHGKPVDVVAAGRLVRLCCKMCKKDLAAEPAKFIAALDEKAKAVQGPAYPLNTCVVSGEELGSMGEAVERVYAGRLVKFCCKACIKDFKKEPAKYLAKIDEAWKAKGGVPHAGK